MQGKNTDIGIPDSITAMQFRELVTSGVLIQNKNRFHLSENKALISTIFKKGDTSIAGNRKIKNAKRIEVGGIKFESRLEEYAYRKFTEAKLSFTFQKKYILMPRFKDSAGNTVRQISWKADFVFDSLGIVVDTKGYQTDQFKIKLKIFRNLYPSMKIYLPSTKGKVDALCLTLRLLLETK